MVVLFPSSRVVDLVTTGRGGATPRQVLLSLLCVVVPFASLDGAPVLLVCLSLPPLLCVVVPFASLDGDGGFRCSFCCWW